MNIEMAPLEGLTTYIYRNAYAHHFGKIDKYYTPFLSLHKEKEFSHKEKKELLPAHNAGLLVVPQVLTNSSEDFLKAAQKIAALGYEEININLGCPSGTVTAKGKGAGMLEDVQKLDAFLEEIFARTPVAVSVKTRLGMKSADEWAALLAVYNRYPLKELIVHARVRDDFYKNGTDWQAFGKALAGSSCPVCYNGDIFSVRDYEKLMQTFPALQHVMLGRGLLAAPDLPERLRQAEADLAEGRAEAGASVHGAEEGAGALDTAHRPGLSRLRAFHDEIYQGYQELQMGERNVLFRMKELWTYLICSFGQAEKYMKKIRKAGGYAGYEKAVEELFSSAWEREQV